MEMRMTPQHGSSSFAIRSAGDQGRSAGALERGVHAASTWELRQCRKRSGDTNIREWRERRASMLLRGDSAFTLLEVMIACGIFFIAIFAILALVASTLRNAQVLRRVDVDAGMVAAQLFKTNRLYEGSESGDFGNIFPDYSWETMTQEAFPFTNGLWQVDIVVRRRGRSDAYDSMTVWVYSPESRSS